MFQLCQIQQYDGTDDFQLSPENKSAVSIEQGSKKYIIIVYERDILTDPENPEFTKHERKG